MRTLICTVGTSLITNRDGRPFGPWRTGEPLPEAAVVDEWLQQADWTKASAETHTLDKLDVADQDKLVLLHTQVDEGRFCAERFKGLFETRCRTVELVPIPQLGYSAAAFSRGLSALVAVACEQVRGVQREKRTPVFCATAGFKAEAAFLTMVGALMGVEVVYVHERHEDIVRLPVLPIAWDLDFVRDNENFFRWIDEEPRPDGETRSRLRANPELERFVLRDADGTWMLNPAGELLYCSAKDAAPQPATPWPEPTDREPRTKNGVSQEEHHRPTGWNVVIDRLCRDSYVTAVRYGDEASSGLAARILDAASGQLALRYEHGGNKLPLIVETTARGDAQCKLLLDHLRRYLKG